MFKYSLTITIFLYASQTLAALSHAPSLHWQTLHSKHFRIHFHDGAQHQAKHLANLAEAAHDRLTRSFNWSPKDATDIVLSDEQDLANGSADAVPYNIININISPPFFIPELKDYTDWLEAVFIHEYVHVLHLDKARGYPLGLRRIFGRLFWLFPNRMQPTWLVEGLATYHETDISRGIGRGQNSYFNMIMRMEVEQGIKPLRQINQDLADWPSGKAAYLYGVHFYQFIRDTYGAEVIQSFISGYSGQLLPYFINRNAKKTLGEDLPSLWQKYQTYLGKQFKTQLRILKRQPGPIAERLTQNAFHRLILQSDGKNQLYLLSQDAKQQAYISKWPITGPPIKVNALSQFDVHPDAGIIIAQPDLLDNALLHYDLYRVTHGHNRTERISRGKRFILVNWHPDGQRLLAVQYNLGRTNLVELDLSAKVTRQLWQAQPNEIIAAIDISPQGEQLVASLFRPESGWNLELFEFATGRWRALTHDTAIEEQPRFSTDGQSILFSADYAGIYNIHRLDLVDGQFSQITHELGGGFQPIHMGNALYFSAYHGKGFDLFKSTPEGKQKPHIQTGANAKSTPTPTPTPATAYTIKPYRPWRALRPRAWNPTFLFDTYVSTIGASSGGFDPLLRHRYGVFAAYDMKNELENFSLQYLYDRRRILWQLGFTRSHNLFVADSNRIIAISQQNQLQLGALLPFLSLNRQWSLQAALIQSVNKTVRNRPANPLPLNYNDGIAGIGLNYTSSRRWPISISRSHGQNLFITLESHDVIDNTFTGNTLSLSWREFIAMGRQHVLAMAIHAGKADPGARPFQLGGQQSAPSSDVLSGITIDARFNRRRYPLRGYPNNQNDLLGNNMLSTSLEWRFPIARPERGLMAPPLALQTLSGNLFIDTGDAWGDAESYNNHTGVGAEINTELRLGYFLPVFLTLGAASGLDHTDQYKIYIRFGSSF